MKILQILFGIEHITQTDSKMTAVQANLLHPTYKDLKKERNRKKENEILSETARFF